MKKRATTKDAFLSASINEDNIKELLEEIENEDETKIEKVYTMVQVNSPCKVTITERSCEICASVLMD